MSPRRAAAAEDARPSYGDMTAANLTIELGEPDVRLSYLEPRGFWKPEKGRPVFADDDPAVMIVIARCVNARTAFGGHVENCGWCDLPLDQLLLAADWTIADQRFLVSETWVWPGGYARTVRANVYENPVYAAFAALPAADQRRRVEDVLTRSRIREHEAYCVLPVDHEGDCNNPPDDD